MSIGLEYEFTFRATLKAPVDYGPAPAAHRLFFEVTGGEVEGERLSGTVTTGGGDWLAVGPDGFGRLDVRAGFQTTDGADVLIEYGGLLEMNAAVGNALQTGAGTTFEDQYFRTTPRLTCGDERYAWVNASVFVGEGHILEGAGVEYRVHRVT